MIVICDTCIYITVNLYNRALHYCLSARQEQSNYVIGQVKPHAWLSVASSQIFNGSL